MSARLEGLFVPAQLRRRWWRSVRLAVAGMAAALVGSVLWAPPLLAAPGGGSGLVVPPGRSVPVKPIRPRKASVQAMPKWNRGSPAWPAGGTTSVAVDTGGSGAARSAPKAGAAGAGRVGGLPVTVRYPGGEPVDPRADVHGAAAGAGSVRISVAGRDATNAAGVTGVLFTVARADGASGSSRVALDIDYSGFSNAYGGDFGGRLRLVRLPACVLTTPSRPQCQVQTPVSGSRNIRQSGVVSIDAIDVSAANGWSGFPAPTAGADTVPVDRTRIPSTPANRAPSGRTGTPRAAAESGGQAVYALTAAPSSDAGTYTATSLSPTYSWGAGSQGGEFTYSIPLQVPPSLGGPTPELTLRYSSGSVDGKTTSTNNQPSWIGEGWDLQTGYIERSFTACNTDGQDTGDLCWLSDSPTHMTTDSVATMVFNGHSTRVIKDDTTGQWHGETDDGSRIELLTGADNDDGGDAGPGGDVGEYWKVTTVDGTQYFFGRNHRFAGDPEPQNSAQTVLAYGNDSNEPCYNTTPWLTGCDQAYRWNLDYVVDPRGNSMTYFYEKYRELYGNWNATDNHAYDLTARLARIEYGTRAGSEATSTAPMRVLFGEGPRCSDPACVFYPDTPWDLVCGHDWGVQCEQTTPTFWTPWRLQAVLAQVWDAAAGDYRDADLWGLSPEYPDPGNGDDPSLWFGQLDRTGYAADGSDLAAPQMDFSGAPMANHVLGAPGSDLNHWRLNRIDNGTGGRTTVTYSGQDCNATIVNGIDKKYNTRRCFPDGGSTMWFHKYVVTSITESDLTQDDPNLPYDPSPDETWSYEYSTDGAESDVLWHFDNAEQVPVDRRTWNDFAGYATVTVRHGPPGGTRSVTRKLFHRGMDGDYMGAGTSLRSGTIEDSSGTLALDQYPLRGFLREEQTLNGSDEVMNKTLHGPTLNFTNGAGTGTAHRSADFPGADLTAYMLREYLTTTATWVSATNNWRTTQTQQSFDDYGLVDSVTNYGDVAVATDDTCTTTSYATRDTTKWLINYPSQVITTDCATNPSNGNFLSGSQTQYDGGAVGAAPTLGLTTQTNALASVAGATLTWTQASRAGYDSYGRVTAAFDALNHQTTTVYTPATGGPLTATTVTNPADHVTTTTTDGARGVPVAVVDANNKITLLRYDPLGRLTKVFKPHTSGPTTTLPDLEYTYTLPPLGPISVSTKTLGPNGNQIESVELYDGRFRPRQSQTPADQAHGGRIITDTVYDERNLTAQTSVFYNDDSGPSNTEFVQFANANVKKQHRYTYDALNRQTADALYSANVLKWQTITGYDGDRTWTVPPAGGTASMTLTNAQGKTVGLRQYLTGVPPTGGTYQITSYGYDRLSRLTAVTDPAGNTWSTSYDRRGRVTQTVDPDKGTTNLDYDDAGDLTKTTDARNVVSSYSYDSLGRKTGIFEGPTTSGFKRADWVYDTIAKGLLTSSHRFHNSTDTYTTAVTGYNDQYQPLGLSVTIPPVTGQPAGTYTVTTGYNIDGSVASTTYPAAGTLAQETVNNTYDSTGRLTRVVGQDTYIDGTAYYDFGAVNQRLLGSGTKHVQLTTTIDEATGRLTSDVVATQNQTTTSAWDQRLVEGYGYDNAGNVKSIKETNGSTVVANQCFNYDKLRQLTEAWTTASGTCQASPTQANVGGADAYWTSYAYDNPTGNRTTEAKHASGSGTITRTYAYLTNAAGGKKHKLDNVTISGAATGTDSYGYDNTGNTITRTITGTAAQALTWDDEGHLATVTDAGATNATKYVYDADGNRLVATEPSGTVTVYLSGFELRTAGGATTCTRYYAGVASRTTGGPLTWLATDHHNTSQLAIDAGILSAIRRKTDPFGNPRGTDPTWPNTRGFVNGIRDTATGLTHLGAREYEPTTGRFVSVDPLLLTSDPQQFNAYGYSGNNPVTTFDPDGTCEKLDDPNGPCVDNHTAVANYTGMPKPKPPACKNHGGTINCPLTPDESDLRKRGEDMKDEHDRACMTGGAACFELSANPYETAWCFKFGPAACASAMLAAEQAEELANKMYPGKGKTDRQWNAFHHAMWMAIIAANGGVSKDEAMLLGVAHELGAYLKRNYEKERGRTDHDIDYGTDDSRADMRNNSIGYDIGKGVPMRRGGHGESIPDYERIAEVIKAKVDAGLLELSGV